MSLDAVLLQKLADWRPHNRQTLSVSDESSPWTVDLCADRNDQIGCLVWEMTVRRPTPPAVEETVHSRADHIARRVRGLLETLKVIEVDATRNEALLRSAEPTARGEDLFYYELLLKGTNEVLFRRYRAAQIGSGGREQVAFALTHETLVNLVDDLTSSD
jgi:hypothetical protein